MGHPLLYMIGTPLGNKKDITARAVEVLESVEVVYAEDTREVKKLLGMLGVSPAHKHFASYAQHNMKRATEQALETLRAGKSIAFVSDRGTPGISDPGALLAERAWEAGFPVVPVPGPSSVAALLSVAGFPADRFVFLGFLPDKRKERDALLEGATALGLTLCLFESPRRIRKLLEELAERFPRGEVVLGREMTKIHETYQRFALSEWETVDIREQGEFTVALRPGPADAAEIPWDDAVHLRLASDKEWARRESQRLGVSAKHLYDALQKAKSRA